MDNILISAKNLGALALENACPRCFWLKNKIKGGLPYGLFPGIFSSIDSYFKKVVNSHLQEFGTLPPWMPWKGRFESIKPPHHTKFRWTDPATNITISGVADMILRDGTGLCHIPDAKTAKFTTNQDKLLPMYRIQNNAYAMIWESMGNTVDEFPLIYCQPMTDENDCEEAVWSQGFDMHFDVKILHVARDFDFVRETLVKAREILDGPLPDAADGCKDCEKLGNIVMYVHKCNCS